MNDRICSVILHPIMKSWIYNYRHNQDGSFTVFWALMLSSIMVMVGAAYDLSAAQTAKSKAQNFADTIALTAAINVKNNGGIPQSNAEGYVEGVHYNLSDLGFFIEPYVKTDATNTPENWATVRYDETAGQITVDITGRTKTAFMNIIGVEQIEFAASATVDYAVDEINNSLSVALVLDTSGSMYYYDETNVQRELAMETAAKDLMHNLSDLVAGQEDNGRILRTGMIPYYSYIWSSHVVNMKWGTVSDYSINSLYEGGGTNSSDSMELADTWMQNENAYHENETGRTDPKKYVILMTDGVNNHPSYDADTLAACTSMKDAGVTIFTIGYALNAQTYGAPNGSTYTPPQAEIDQATALLSSCATDAAHFKTTDNDTSLDEIFEGIGAEIAASFLRISH